ncbi:uncharacterized protein K452DRAFT_65063 [Aplosporella prunicola CBS 121167]|uniref:Uncharacterized protein n=1 Tax=Aplosporella prunicola CBS 121167 TaxID=1176127 RepID=A0A6A6B6V9_9PEZI|nr:uncharacterized protein K452DRAFT_65063 [Aplosporella prunicola CBS 121167]KAF2139750.1 hypothetical protein K452DRAFT_65063 [Aplosporella prunicola CBS 121167]
MRAAKKRAAEGALCRLRVSGCVGWLAAHVQLSRMRVVRRWREMVLLRVSVWSLVSFPDVFEELSDQFGSRAR